MSTACDRPRHGPLEYGPDKLARLQARQATDFGRAIRAYTPLFFPNAPPEVFFGFTAGEASLGQDQRASGSPPFHELGPFQDPGGNWNEVAPTGNGNNIWRETHDDVTVRQALGGRSATMVPDAWKTAPLDQAAQGLAMLRRESRAANASLPAEIRAEELSSLWYVMLGFMKFSGAAPSVAAHLAPYAAQLAAVSEADRWWLLVYLVAQDAQRGVLPGTRGTHSDPAYTILREWERLQSGYELAKANRVDTSWFGPMGSNEVRTLAAPIWAGACGGSTGGGLLAPFLPSTKTKAEKIVLATVLVAGIAGAVTGGVVLAKKYAKGRRRRG